MKVLYISGMYPTPAYPQKGIFCHEQVKALKNTGVDVDVVVPMTVYDKEYTAEYWDYEGIRIRYLRYFKIPGTSFFENIGKHLYHALLKAKIDFTQYDVIHADAPLPAGDAARMISDKYHIPFIVHGHGLDVFLDNSYKGLKNCEKIAEACAKVYSAADAVTGVSRKVLDNVQARVDIRGKDFVVYNGVDTERFRPDPQKPQSNVLRLVSVGNLIPLKGHDLTIKALKELHDSGYDNFSLTIAGRGPMEQELKALVSSLGLDDKVTFIGYVPYDDIVKLLQTSDVFVMPSWYEALGCVYLEAMACGLPAIGCKGCGIDEIIVDGENGFLVEPKDVKSITDCLKKLTNNNDYARIANNAFDTVINGYKWNDTALALERVYRHISAK